MSETPRYATLRDYLHVVWSRRVLITVIAVVFGFLACVVAVRQNKVYKAETSLSVDDIAADPSILGDQQNATTTPEGRGAVLSALVTRNDTVAAVRRDLHLNAPLADIASRVSGQTEVRTAFVIIQAKSGDPKFAATLANAFARAVAHTSNQEARNKYIEAARVIRQQLAVSQKPTKSKAVRQERFQTSSALRQRLAGLQAVASYIAPVKIVEKAAIPSTPISPKPVRNTLIGLFVGFLLAVLLAFLRDALDRRFRGAAEIRDALDLPLVGHVRDELMGRTMVTSNGRAALTDADMEAFRIMRSNLQYLDIDSPPKSLLITSPVQQEGKSTVSTAIATALAFTGKRTLLVECDMRRPVLASRLALKQGPGLSDYLLGNSTPADVTQVVQLPPAGNGDNGADSPIAAPSFVAITAGSPTSRPAELLGSGRFRLFLEQVTEAYDHVILDACPLLSVGDTLALIPHVDGIVLCVRASRTTRHQAEAAKTALRGFPARPTGVVVTGLRHGDESDYGYYSYAYGAEA